MTSEQLKDFIKTYLKENAQFEVYAPSCKDSTMRVTLTLEGEEIATADVWASDIPKDSSQW
ncbi:hypothetical protein CkP1_0093 [Citrobacter phage CkP1]|nr:hypothetical protein CkP1_0093 [Citrobacter phage CkP1]